MSIIDLGLVKERLFEDRRVVSRLVRDYGLPTHPTTPEALADALIAAFEQSPAEDPLAETRSNEQAFRAAARA